MIQAMISYGALLLGLPAFLGLVIWIGIDVRRRRDQIEHFRRAHRNVTDHFTFS